MDKIYVGTILNMNQKGYGFISPDDGGMNVFFHASSIESSVFEEQRIGDKVEYLVANTKKGLAAIAVIKRG